MLASDAAEARQTHGGKGEALESSFSTCASTAEVECPVQSWEEHPPPEFANRFTAANQPTLPRAQSAWYTAMVIPAPSSKEHWWLGDCRNGDMEKNEIRFCKPETTQVPDAKARRKQTLNFCRQQNQQEKKINFLL